MVVRSNGVGLWRHGRKGLRIFIWIHVMRLILGILGLWRTEDHAIVRSPKELNGFENENLEWISNLTTRS